MSATPDISSCATIISTTSMFYALLVPALILWYVYWRISRRHFVEFAEKIPGPKGYPILGNALEFVGSSHGMNFK